LIEINAQSRRHAMICLSKRERKMSYKTILVCLTNLDNAERLSKIACSVARKFGAHLIGIHTLRAMEVYPEIALHITADITRSFDERQQAEADKIRNIFVEVARPEDFVSEWRTVKAASENTANRLIEHARCADLIIMPQPDKRFDRADQVHIQRDVIENCGRPVLVIPYTGDFQTIGENMLIGWSATKEATRATHDAIPFAQHGGRATVFWITRSSSKDSYLAHTGHEIATCLDRNGVKANVSHRNHTGISIGDEILNEATEIGADMIVSGAYGHSRVYDFVIGATTPHLMKHMTVPVLFSC